VAEAGPVSIYVLHDIQQLKLDPAAAGFHIVVSGHSHRHGSTERNGVLYVNPGSAGPRRFRLPVTLARVDLAISPWNVEFIDLLEGVSQLR
jgi:predicted phosphodiesterase